MKTSLLTGLLLVFGAMKAQAMIFEHDLGGFCRAGYAVRTAAPIGDIVMGQGIRFDFPERLLVTIRDQFGHPTQRRFGAGKVVIEQNVETVDRDLQKIVKPMRVEFEVTRNGQTKRHIRAVFTMYNPFTEQMQTEVVEHAPQFDQEIVDSALYRESVANSPNWRGAVAGELVQTFIHCNFDDLKIVEE